MPLIRWLGSLSFTVVICVLMIVFLIVSTTTEAKLGTEAAQKIFYQTRWFDLLLSLFWINIFCSTALRFPFKPGHVGFIVTHLGILILLVGSLMARIGGVEGRMALYEGETSQSILTGGYRIAARGPDGVKQTFVLSKENQRLGQGWAEVKPRVGKIIEHASEKEVVSDGGSEHPLNRAIHIRLESPMMEMKRDFWLMESSPINPEAHAMIMGPAHFLLKAGEERTKKVQRPVLIVKDQERETLRLNVDEPAASVVVGESGWRIENVVYYPKAAVNGRELVNGSEETPDNPAVSFEAVDANGTRQRIIKFALFPDFESMHPQTGAVPFPFDVEFQVPSTRVSGTGMSSLAFLYWPDGRWTYEVAGKDDSVQEGDIKKGEKIPLSWADMTFEILEMYDRAEVTTAIVASEEDRGPFAAEIIMTYKGQDYSQWLAEDQNVRFTTDGGDYRFSISPNTLEVPFALTLKDFRKTDYPGTMAAAAYESDVTLDDMTEAVSLHRTISMNQPLDYKGYRIFQSSFAEDTGRGEASIFTVAKNPGIPLIYLGSCIIFIGAAYQFYGPKNGFKNKNGHDHAAV